MKAIFFDQLSRKKNHEIFSVSLRDFDRFLNIESLSMNSSFNSSLKLIVADSLMKSVVQKIYVLEIKLSLNERNTQYVLF